MPFVPGEYVFTCGDCDGSGEIEVGCEELGDREWVQCPDCDGDKVRYVDEREAADLVYAGATPIAAPEGYSPDGLDDLSNY